MHLHFDCFSGISGDMVLGACVDAGVPLQWLQEQIQKLPIEAVEIACQDVTRQGVGAKQIRVIEKSKAHPRNYRSIVNLIEGGDLSAPVKKTASDIFRRIAQAEAAIHGCAIDDVHFHEVGAVDSIVDIVGAALCFEYLQIQTASSTALPLGSGFVNCAHGRLPVPAPATLEILKGVPVYGSQAKGELVTPTGAGIVASIADKFGRIPSMDIERIGYGSGSRELADRPNLLRVLIGKPMDRPVELNHEHVVVVETNIDDMSPELFGFLMEKLFEEGALDVSLISVIMKKNRPGIKVEVLCPPERQDAVISCLLTESSTIGVRYQLVPRQILKRTVALVSTRFGEIQVKCTQAPGGLRRYAPEYDACRAVALQTGVPISKIYETVYAAVQDEANLKAID